MPTVRVLSLLIPAVTGIVLGVAAFQLAQSGGGDEPPLEAGTPLYPGWDRDPSTDERARSAERESPGHPSVETARQAVVADSTAARFSGRLGSFTIAGRQPLRNFACSTPSAIASSANTRASELFFSRPGFSGVEGIACGGEVYGISGAQSLGGQSSAIVYRNYFNASRPRLPIDAPEGRISQRTVDGHAAVVVLPRQALFPECRLFMIERDAGSGEPGIVWEISGTLTCQQAEGLAADLLGEVGS